MKHLVNILVAAALAPFILGPSVALAVTPQQVLIPTKTSTAQPTCTAAREGTIWSRVGLSGKPTVTDVCACDGAATSCHWQAAATSSQLIGVLAINGDCCATGVSAVAGYTVPAGQKVTFTKIDFVVQTAGSGGGSTNIIFVVFDGTNTCTFTGPSCSATAAIFTGAGTGTCTFDQNAALLFSVGTNNDCVVKPKIGVVQFGGYFFSS